MSIENPNFFRKIESFPGLESKREKKPPKGLNSLKEEISDLIEGYSAEKFSASKTEKTKEIGIYGGEIEQKRKIAILEKIIGPKKIKVPEATMLDYPAETFRNEDWFRNFPEDKKEKIETEIAQHIYSKILKNLDKHYRNFFEKLNPEVRQFFEKNREIRKNPMISKEEKGNLGRKQSKKLSDKEKEGILKAIGDFEEKFGHLPGDSGTLEVDCAGYVDFAGKILEHYGFEVRPIHMPGHISLMLKAGGEHCVSDINFKELIPIRDYVKMKKVTYRGEIESIGYGGSGSYESSVHFGFGNLLRDFDKLSEAENQFREAIRLNPNDAAPHLNLGEILYRLKKFPEAEKEFREMLKINPNLVEAHHNLGVILSRSGKEKFPEAEKEFREALKINPNFIEAHRSLAMLYLAMGQSAKAKGEAREAINRLRNKEEAERLEKVMIRELGIDAWSK